MLSTELVTGLA